MKVGGNESATKFFQSNGGTAALASKDPKTKYTSNAATKYKDELKRRVARDAQESVDALLERNEMLTDGQIPRRGRDHRCSCGQFLRRRLDTGW